MAAGAVLLAATVNTLGWMGGREASLRGAMTLKAAVNRVSDLRKFGLARCVNSVQECWFELLLSCALQQYLDWEHCIEEKRQNCSLPDCEA